MDDVRYGGDTHLYLYICLCMYMYMHMCMYMYMHLYMCMVVTIKINIIVYLQFAMRCCIMPNNSMLSYIEVQYLKRFVIEILDVTNKHTLPSVNLDAAN